MRGRKCTGLFLGLVAILSLAVFGQEAMAQSERGKAKVLVLPFKVNAPGDAESLRKSISQQLSDRLRKEGVAVVDSATAASVLKAKKVKEVVSAQQARELARAAKASYAVMGSLSVVGDSLSLDAKSVGVGSNLRESAGVYATGPGLVGLSAAVDDLAGKLKGEFVAGAAAPAGAPGSGLTGEKVAEVDVEGNNALEKDVVLLKVKTQVGEPFDSKTVNEDLKRLFDLGYFDDVQIRVDNVRGGKKVVFVVKEKPRIQAVGVNGAVEIKKDDILEAMSTKAGSVLNLQVLADDLEKIRELYRKKGYYQTEVSYSLEQTDPRLARLNINIKEAKKLYIKEIRILGAKQVSVSDLKDEMGLKEKNFLSWIMQTGVLKEELLERDTAAIENYYTNHGYIDARVGQPQVDIQPDGIVLTFQVEEGERYKVGSVGYRGDLLMDNDKLATLTKAQELVQKKEFFDRSVVRNDIAKLTEAYSDMGYAFADCDVDMKKRGEEKIVDLTYVITKNQKVYVRRVTVEGNDKTRENVIRRELRLSDGDLFSGSKVKRSNERLNKLDYFDKVDVETVPTENPGEVDLRVRVKDKNTGSISAGVGYSTSDSVFFGGNIEERNLFGKGYAAQFSGMISGRTTRFVLSFTNPAVYDSKLSAGTDLYATKRQFDDFYKDAYGGDIRFAYPIGEYSTLAWNYRLEHDYIYHTNLFATSMIQEWRGWHWTSSVYGGFTRDTSDSRTKPTKGTINEFAVTYAGLGGDVGYVKPFYSFNWYRSLPLETVFHIRAQGSVLIENGFGDFPVFERFYMGGINNIRGYAVDSISPRSHLTGEHVGGDTMYFANLEYIFPLNKHYGVYGLGFFDAGNTIWRERDGFNPWVYKSVGVGLRWFSPMGLLRVEYGYGLDAEAHNMNPSQVGFTIGQSF